MVVELRIALLSDGTVRKVEVMNQSDNPLLRQVAESAVRAVMKSSPLKLPPGSAFTSMVMRFHPDKVIE